MEKVAFSTVVDTVVDSMKLKGIEVKERGNRHTSDVHNIIFTVDVPGLGVVPATMDLFFTFRYDREGGIAKIDTLDEEIRNVSEVFVDLFEMMEESEGCLVDFATINWGEDIDKINEKAISMAKDFVENDLIEDYILGNVDTCSA